VSSRGSYRKLPIGFRPIFGLSVSPQLILKAAVQLKTPGSAALRPISVTEAHPLIAGKQTLKLRAKRGWYVGHSGTAAFSNAG